MIGVPPETDMSFFTALAQIVRQSGLRPAEIARRANAPIKEAVAKIVDPAERILTEMSVQYLHRGTISRAIKGESSISEKTLARIADGLDLDEETRLWLEELRKAEPYVHHSTQHRAIVQQGDAPVFPAWLECIETCE